MIKDILLHVSRSYNPYVQQRELWGAGSTYRGELDNDFNGRKFIKFDNSTDWNIVTVGNDTAVGIKTDNNEVAA